MGGWFNAYMVFGYQVCGRLISQIIQAESNVQVIHYFTIAWDNYINFLLLLFLYIFLCFFYF